MSEVCGMSIFQPDSNTLLFIYVKKIYLADFWFSGTAMFCVFFFFPFLACFLFEIHVLSPSKLRELFYFDTSVLANPEYPQWNMS